jgi:hypothetical protein
MTTRPNNVILSLIVLGFCAICMPVKAAAREPKGFKFPDGQFVPWGIQDSEFIKSLQGNVIDLDGFKKDFGSGYTSFSYCENPEDFGCNAATKLPKPYDRIFFTFKKGRFCEVDGYFLDFQFNEAERSLVRVLGEPSDRDSQALENGFGAVFKHVIDNWRGGKVWVRLEEAYPGKDNGKMMMQYEPLCKETSEPPAPAPF